MKNLLKYHFEYIKKIILF